MVYKILQEQFKMKLLRDFYLFVKNQTKKLRELNCKNCTISSPLILGKFSIINNIISLINQLILHKILKLCQIDLIIIIIYFEKIVKITITL